MSLTRKRNFTLCSRPSGIRNFCVGVPRIDNCGEVSARSSTSASAPDPSTLFATVTPASNSSPGAASTGTLGVTTKGPRISASRSLDPVVSLETPTAIIFSVPSKKSGTL